MRTALSILLVTLVMGACAPATDHAAEAPAEDSITVTTLADPAIAPDESAAPEEAPLPAEPDADDATMAEAEAAPPTGPTPMPPALAAAARACADGGGTLRPRGQGGLWSCVRLARDGGRTCSRGGDCEGECLARSRTCAPLEPLFGCHEVLDRAGRPQTLCRE